MSNFKVGDIVLVNKSKDARDFMEAHFLNPDTYQCVITYLSEDADGEVKIAHATSNIYLAWTRKPDKHFTLYKKKRTPPIKRKGYALWIHNIECKSKRGVK